MTKRRRPFRPTMLDGRNRSGSHKRLGGAANAGLAAMRTDLPDGEKQCAPGSGIWRDVHGRKSAMLFCEALRSLKAMGLTPDRDARPLNAYPCHLGPGPGLTAGLHWHTGHLRPGVRPTRPVGVTLA